MSEELKLLLERQAVIDVIYTWSTAIDTRDWPLLRSIFTDTIHIDYSSNGSLNEEMPADKWVKHLNQLEGHDATLHITTNHVVKFDGDKATCVSYVNAMHFLREGEEEYHAHACGVYTHSLLRVGKHWKVTAVLFKVAGRQGGHKEFDRGFARSRAIYAARQQQK